MKPIIIANWKLNPQTLVEAKKLFGAVKRGIKDAKAQVIICPPLPYIAALEGLALGAQTVSFHTQGAFTGEVSASQLKDLGVTYAIIGHSERRRHLEETDEIINKKIKAALQVGLKIILCVGEHEGEEKAKVLERELSGALQDIAVKHLKHILVAYEPVWAIGTGKSCMPDETMGAILLIRKILGNMYNRTSVQSVPILYGGSVTAQNAAPYIKEAGANGLLVGGSSLKSEEFIAIVKSAV